MKTEYKSKILDSLRFIFPTLTFSMLDKDDKGAILVSTDSIPEKKVVKFNPELLEMQFDKGNIDFFNETIKMFAEMIDKRFVKKMNKYRSFTTGRPVLLTAAQIRYAFANSKSCNGAAKVLGVNFRTLVKYVKINGLEKEYEAQRNPTGKGVKRPTWSYNLIPLKEIIYDNKHPNYDLNKLKKRLLSEFVFEEKCSRCGYNERRDYDQEVPIILDFIDGNKKNKHIDNMRFLCYNCAFLIRPLKGKISLKNTKHMRELLSDIKEEIENKEKETIFESFNPHVIKDDNKEDLFDKFNKR